MNEMVLSVTEAERRRLNEFLLALRTPCRAELQSPGGLVSSVFEEEFRSKLLAHHVFIGSPLFQESFESAFVSACRTAGHDVVVAEEGQRFWDVAVDGIRLSLKSTKARSLRNEFLHISKLTEAAWIQDCRSAATRRRLALGLMELYCAEVHAIWQLRFFQDKGRYELVEMSTAILKPIMEVPVSEFRADGPTVAVPFGKTPPDFVLKLDRSDAKITVANVRKELCQVHATWIVGGQTPQVPPEAGS